MKLRLKRNRTKIHEINSWFFKTDNLSARPKGKRHKVRNRIQLIPQKYKESQQVTEKFHTNKSDNP